MNGRGGLLAAVVVGLSACSGDEGGAVQPPVARSEPAVKESPSAVAWEASVAGPVRAWVADTSAVHVRFDWTLRYAGDDVDGLVAAARQKWTVEGSGLPWRVALHPDTLKKSREAKVLEAGFFAPDAGAVPESLTVTLAIEGEPVLSETLHPVAVPMDGLSFELADHASPKHYRGRPREPSAETVRVVLTATNSTDSAVVFNPFAFSSTSGGLDWRYHHTSTQRSTTILEAGESVRLEAALATREGAKLPESVELLYRKESIGTVPVR